MNTLILIMLIVPWLIAGVAIIMNMMLKTEVSILKGRIEQQEYLTMKIWESIIETT